MIRVHHLNCGCMCPLGGAFYDGFSKGLRAHLACHCLLLETAHSGLVLVDTGFGQQDMRQPERISLRFRLLNNIQFDLALTARHQIEALGFSARDVRHVVLTHLDFDHAGGLADFPEATVHVMQAEHQAAQHPPSGLLRRHRFMPHQWQSVRSWCVHPAVGDDWHGFQSVRAITGEEDVLLIPLAGHTAGHAGIATRADGRWLLHAGDAYFYRGEIGYPKRHCPPGLRLYQRLMDSDPDQRRRNQDRLRALSLTHPDMDIFCSHDAIELERLQTTHPRSGFAL